LKRKTMVWSVKIMKNPEHRDKKRDVLKGGNVQAPEGMDRAGRTWCYPKSGNLKKREEVTEA